jgi:hypothetical protein
MKRFLMSFVAVTAGLVFASESFGQFSPRVLKERGVGGRGPVIGGKSHGHGHQGQGHSHGGYGPSSGYGCKPPVHCHPAPHCPPPVWCPPPPCHRYPPPSCHRYPPKTGCGGQHEPENDPGDAEHPEDPEGEIEEGGVEEGDIEGQPQFRGVRKPTRGGPGSVYKKKTNLQTTKARPQLNRSNSRYGR